MAVFRFFSALFMLVAVVAFVADATPLIEGAGAFKATSLAALWDDMAPSSYQAAKAAVLRTAPAWVWSGVIESIIDRPTFLIFGILAVLAGHAGRRRRKVEIFIN